LATSHPELRVDPRFSGPPGIANGGYLAGSLAALLGGDAEVTLRRPAPLGRPLRVRDGGDGALVLADGDLLLAEARLAAAAVELALPGAVTAAEARAAAGGAGYYDDPYFPECFVCGPARRPGDGLRIFPGPVAGRRLWAAPWTPHASFADADGLVRTAVVWAALDCPGGIATLEADPLPAGSAGVLGRITVTLAGRPRPGDACMVVGWPGERDGRKLAAGSAVLGPGGEVLAAARTTWIIVPRPAAAPA
jgi:hypothetical protein